MGDRTAKRLALAGALLAFSLAAPGSAGAAECAGDECQGPPPAPEEVIPGTAVVQGPPNPPVRFPKNHNKGKSKKHPKHAKGKGHSAKKGGSR